MKPFVLITLLALSHNAALAEETLLSTTQQAKQQELQHNQAREQGFEQDLAQLKARQQALLAERDALQKDTDSLSDSFTFFKLFRAGLNNSSLKRSGIIINIIVVGITAPNHLSPNSSGITKSVTEAKPQKMGKVKLMHKRCAFST